MLTKSRVPGWNWLLQRVTALVLTVGLIGHFLVLHYTKLFAGQTVPAQASTAGRFMGSAKFWLLFDGMLLIACLYHAFNGAYNIVLDYNPPAGVRKGLAWFLWILGIAASALGIVLLGRFILYAHSGRM